MGGSKKYDPLKTCRGTNSRESRAGVGPQGSSDKRARYTQQEQDKDIPERIVTKKHPRQGGDAPRTAKRQEFTRRADEACKAILHDSAVDKQVKQEDELSRMSMPTRPPSSRPTGFWLLVHLSPSTIWTWNKALECNLAGFIQQDHEQEKGQAEAGLPRPPVTMGGEHARALLDTEAAQSLLHPLAAQAGLRLTTRHPGVVFTAPSGEQVHTNLMVRQAAIRVGERIFDWDMWVAPSTHPSILAYDFLKASATTWDLQENLLRWRKEIPSPTAAGDKEVLGTPSGKKITTGDNESNTEVLRARPRAPQYQTKNQKRGREDAGHLKTRPEQRQQENPGKGEDTEYKHPARRHSREPVKNATRALKVRTRDRAPLKNEKFPRPTGT